MKTRLPIHTMTFGSTILCFLVAMGNTNPSTTNQQDVLPPVPIQTKTVYHPSNNRPRIPSLDGIYPVVDGIRIIHYPSTNSFEFETRPANGDMNVTFLCVDSNTEIFNDIVTISDPHITLNMEKGIYEITINCENGNVYFATYDFSE